MAADNAQLRLKTKYTVWNMTVSSPNFNHQVIINAEQGGVAPVLNDQQLRVHNVQPGFSPPWKFMFPQCQKQSCKKNQLFQNWFEFTKYTNWSYLYSVYTKNVYIIYIYSMCISRDPFQSERCHKIQKRLYFQTSNQEKITVASSKMHVTKWNTTSIKPWTPTIPCFKIKHYTLGKK